MQLHTERLLLREHIEDDWRAVRAYQSDPRYTRFYPWTERTEAETRQFIQGFIDSQHEEPRIKFAFAVTLKGSGQLIGNCNIRKNTADAPVAEIGYELNPASWGKGYATEAARAILAFGFDELKLHRIGAWCVAENTASAQVLEKLGMRLEGRLREQEWIKEHWWDALFFGILDREWKKV